MTGLSLGPGPPILEGYLQNFVFMITLLPFSPVASHKYDLAYHAPELPREAFLAPRTRGRLIPGT